MTRGLRTLASLPVLLAVACVQPAPATLDLPPRPSDAVSGSEFAASIEGLDLESRDDRIVEEILGGNVPDFLRRLATVRAGVGESTIEFLVTPDYLAVGSESDYLLVPMSPRAAQRLADRLHMSLPTARMVDTIWAAADVKMSPAPIPPSPAMTKVPVFLQHSDAVRSQRRESGEPMGSLVGGHKKDVVVTRSLRANPGRVAIYGWHRTDGTPIQPLYLGHTEDWVDYSHGIRLVARTVRVSGRAMDLWAVLRDPSLAAPISHEGAFLDEPAY